MVCDRKAINTISIALYYAGIAFGAIFFGNLGDRKLLKNFNFEIIKYSTNEFTDLEEKSA